MPILSYLSSKTIKNNINKITNKKTLLWAGGVLVVLFLGYWFFLRNTGPVEQTSMVQPGDFVQQVSVSGKVVAAQDVDLGFSQSGRVSYVRGSVGSVVSEGTVLAEIENGDARANVAQKQATLASQQAKLQSLKNGSRPESIAVAQAAVDGATSALAQANQSIANAILDAYAKSDDAVHNRVDRFLNNPNTLGVTLVFNTSDAQVVSTLISQRVLVGGSLSVWQSENTALSPQVSDMGAAASKAQVVLGQVSSLLTSASAALSQANASQSVSLVALQGYASDVAVGRSNVNAAVAAINSALTAQKSALASLDSANKNLLLVKAGATQADVDAQVALVAGAEADLQNAQALLSKTLIVAPFSGVITKVDAKVGQIVSPNTPEVSMISTGAFQIESYIPEINVAMIHVGNPASVTLDAYGVDTVFDAVVVSIDPAETIQSGVSTYRAVLQFKAQDARIKSGMTANVVITSQKRSGVISVPQGLVVDTNGLKTLKVKRGGLVVVVPVTLGDVSSSGEVEIRSGLQAGDVVVTTLPAAAQ